MEHRQLRADADDHQDHERGRLRQPVAVGHPGQGAGVHRTAGARRSLARLRQVLERARRLQRPHPALRVRGRRDEGAPRLDQDVRLDPAAILNRLGRAAAAGLTPRPRRPAPRTRSLGHHDTRKELPVEQILLFILLGLGSGALIAGIALGVVLSYRGSGVINLSTGAMAMLGGYAFWALNTGKIASLPTAAALPLALVFVAACGALTEFAVYRPLR